MDAAEYLRRFISSAMIASPYWILYVAGMVAARVYYRKNRRACMFASISFALFLILSVAFKAAMIWVEPTVYAMSMHGADPAVLSWIIRGFHGVWYVGQATAICLLLVALEIGTRPLHTFQGLPNGPDNRYS